MTDTATSDRPCAWYACLDQAATGRLFCAAHNPSADETIVQLLTLTEHDRHARNLRGAIVVEDDSAANHEPERYDDFLPEEAPD